MKLLDQHREHLRASGLSDATIDASGIYSVTEDDEAARLLSWKSSAGPAPAMGFPVHGLDGAIVQTVLRPDEARTREDGSIAKYEQPLGDHHRVWFPPPGLVPHDRLMDLAHPLIFVEARRRTQSGQQGEAERVAAPPRPCWRAVSRPARLHCLRRWRYNREPACGACRSQARKNAPRRWSRRARGSHSLHASRLEGRAR
jgi:hypothetical protein